MAYGHTGGTPRDQSYWDALRTASTTVIDVASESALNSALAAADPGDCIRVANGTYTWSINEVIERSGTAANPIVLMPYSRRGVTFANQYRFNSLKLSNHWIVGGFNLNYVTREVCARNGSSNNIFADCALDHCGSTTAGSDNWYKMADVNHYGSTAASDNVFEYLECNDLYGFFRYVAESTDAQLYQSKRNIWRYMTFLRHAQTDNAPAIQLGAGSEILADLTNWLYDTDNEIYGCLFQDWASGYTEMISIKTSSNRVYNNKILDSDGRINLRIGDRNKIFGNLFIDNSNIYDDHLCIGVGDTDGSEIYNNIMQHKRGYGIRVFRGGGTDDNNHGHPGVKNTKIYNNTIIGSRTSPINYSDIHVGHQGGNYTANRAFVNLEVKNNILTASTGSRFAYDLDGVGTDTVSFSYNNFYNTGSGTNGSGYATNTNAVSGNPQLDASYLPNAAGVAYAAGIASQYTTDFYGNTRKATPDIGAAETAATPPANNAPNGTIDTPATNQTITAGQSVTFTGTGTDPDGDAMTYLWNFGGGATNSTLQDPGPVAFNTAGVYTVTFTVTDSHSAADPTPPTVTITVNAAGGGNTAPTGSIDSPAGNTTINAGQYVNFTGSGTDAESNYPLTYHWDFGGGATNSTAQNPGHVNFLTAGTYTVTFTVTDSLGTVDATPPTVTITVNSTAASTVAALFVSSVDGDYKIKFGDGVTKLIKAD